MTGSDTPQQLTAEQAERFKQVAWPHVDALLRTARFLARHRDAEDLVQETMLKAMRSIETFREGSDARAWLMTILRHTHIDRLRAARRRGADVSLDAASIDPADPHQEELPTDEGGWDGVEPDALLSRFEDATMVEAMRELSEEMRWTLLLVDVEQMDHRTAAGVLGVAEGTIKSRASRARAALRDRLMNLAKLRGWVQETAS